MKNKRTELWKKYPKLFRGRNYSIRKNLMPFGFEHGNGWLDILDEAGAKLETEIEKYLKDNPNSDCECDHSKLAHPMNEQCINIKEVSLRWGRSYGCYVIPGLWQDLTVRYPKHKWYAVKNWFRHVRNKYKFLLRQLINKILNKFFIWFHLHKKIYCDCQKYYQWHPMAVQIKEKYGTMRFYMSACTTEMDKISEWAEKESCKICEDCGSFNPIMHYDGWIRNLCNECEKKRITTKVEFEKKYITS